MKHEPIAHVSIGKRTRVQINEVVREGEVFVDVRKNFMDDEDEWRPTKKGIQLDKDTWLKVIGNINEYISESETE